VPTNSNPKKGKDLASFMSSYLESFPELCPLVQKNLCPKNGRHLAFSLLCCSAKLADGNQAPTVQKPMQASKDSVITFSSQVVHSNWVKQKSKDSLVRTTLACFA
jgi:hypothetical protein